MEPAEVIKCMLCGLKFDPTDAGACSSCPIKSDCKVICCPNCGYRFVDEDTSRAARFLKKLFEGKKEVKTK